MANGQVQIDVEPFSQWIDATARGEDELAEFYRARFREEFVPAFEAWLAMNPLATKGAPLSPFAILVALGLLARGKLVLRQRAASRT